MESVEVMTCISSDHVVHRPDYNGFLIVGMMIDVVKDRVGDRTI